MTVMHTEHAPPYERVFDQSYERVHSGDEHGLNFFDGFYQNFLGLSDEIRDKFKNTDMPKQRSMLEKSFYHLLVFYATGNADDYMQRMVERHGSRGINIPIRLYDSWMDSLIKTVEQFDPEFNADIALAWRLVLAPGLTYMKYR